MTSATSDPRVGTELAGYRIESLLGRGGMSDVYLATDLRLKRKVALKLLAPDLARDEKFRERFLRESELAASIDHPNVIPIYEAGEVEDLLYIAMRYVDGTDLKKLLEEEHTLTPRRALALTDQAADALDAAHESGLVHRDVKPGNILIASRGERDHCYLTDFGLTKDTVHEGSLTEAGQVLGTIDYVAPEQIEGDDVDGRADVYSLGCVLYKCLTGEPPFTRQRKLQVLFAHLKDDPPPASSKRADLTKSFDQVIDKALEKDADKRYESCGELAEAARAALGLSTAELPVPPLEPERSRKRPALIASVVGLVLIVAAVVAAVLITGGGGDEAVPPATTTLTTNAIQRIDPETGDLVATIPIASSDALGVGEGFVWVLDKSERALAAIDPATNEVSREVSLEAVPGTPHIMVTGAGAVWFGYDAFAITELRVHEWLWAYDVETESLAQSPIGNELIFLFGTSHGDLWGAPQLSAAGGTGESLRQLVRLPAQEPERATELEFPETESESADFEVNEIASSNGDLWVSTLSTEPLDPGARNRIYRVDQATSDVGEGIDLPGDPTAIAADDRGLWLTYRTDGKLRKIDADTNQLEDVLTLRNPEELAIAGRSLWVTNSRDGVVFRINPETLDVETIPVGGTPIDIAAGEGGVWVTVRPR